MLCRCTSRFAASLPLRGDMKRKERRKKTDDITRSREEGCYILIPLASSSSSYFFFFSPPPRLFTHSLRPVSLLSLFLLPLNGVSVPHHSLILGLTSAKLGGPKVYLCVCVCFVLVVFLLLPHGQMHSLWRILLFSLSHSPPPSLSLSFSCMLFRRLPFLLVRAVFTLLCPPCVNLCEKGALKFIVRVKLKAVAILHHLLLLPRFLLLLLLLLLLVHLHVSPLFYFLPLNYSHIGV